MAISPKNLYPSRVIDGNAGYPYGKALNLQNGIQGTGTPLEEKWVNDQWGFHQALLAEAGIVPNGSPDKVGGSQYLDAIATLITDAVTPVDTLVNDEISDRQAADTVLQDNITSEETARISADDDLLTEINKLATETQVGRVEKSTEAEALTGEVDKFMDAALTQRVIQEYGLNVVKSITSGAVLDTTLPSGLYSFSGAVTSLPSGATSATGVSINSASEGFVILGDTASEELFINWQVSEVYSEYAKVKHDKNTNSSLFLAEAVGDVLGEGYGDSTTTGKVYLPLDFYTTPTSITLNGTFGVKSVDGLTTFATGITSITLDSSSSPKRAVLTITGLTGVVNEQPLVLHSVETASSITVE